MDEWVLGNADRLKIFRALTEHRQISFNHLARLAGLRSNALSYQLHQMQEKQFVVHDGELYSLSIHAQRLIPYFSQIFKKEVGVLPVILGIVRDQDKILLLRRKKMPYKDCWGLFGGKQINGESIQETIGREVFEEAGIRARFECVNGIVYERLRDHDQFKHSFLFIVTTLTAQDLNAQEQQEGKVCWFDFNDVITNALPLLIPSDVHIIMQYSDKQTVIEHVIMDETAEGLRITASE